MKTIKTFALVSILTIGLTTSAFASWWNPFTWHWFKKQTPVITQQVTTNNALPIAQDSQKEEVKTSEVNQTTPINNEAVIKILYTKGGEILSLNSPINITYKISDSLKSKISPTDKTELYLLDSKNVLVGYIGKFDINNNEFVWNPQRLTHNAGLDVIIQPTPVGKYRILAVIRPVFVSKCKNCGTGVDTLDNPNTKFENGYFINSEMIKNYPNYTGDKVIASDLSSSLITISSQDSNWKTYQNKNRKFEIGYPSDLSAREIYTHSVIVCFDSQSKPFAVCVDDGEGPQTLKKAFNDLNVSKEFQLDKLEKKLNVTIVAQYINGTYYIYVDNIVIRSSDKSLLKEMLSTLQITGVYQGISK